MKSLLRAGLAAFVAVALSGCSIFGDDEEEEEIEFAPLPEIAQTVEVNTVWYNSVGDGIEEYFSRLSPAVTKEYVYAASRDGIVTAMATETGDEVWRVDLRRDHEVSLVDSLNPFSSTPDGSAFISGGILYAYEKLYLGTEHGEVVALDPATGKIIWKQTVRGEVIARPSAGDGLVFVNTAAGYVEALHPDTGEKRWYFEQEVPPLTLRGVGSVTVANGGVIFGTSAGKVTVLTSDAGLEVWSQAVGTPKGATDLARLVDVDTQPVIVGNTVYAIGYNGNLMALELRTGRVLWKREYSSFRDFAIDGMNIYVTDENDHVFAIDRRNGVERWSQPGLYNRRLTGPYIVNGNLVLGDHLGYLHILDAESGDFKAWYEIGGDGLYAEAQGREGMIFIQTRDGEVSALTLAE